MAISETELLGIKRELVLEDFLECKNNLHLRARHSDSTLKFTLLVGDYSILNTDVVFSAECDKKNALESWREKKISVVFFYNKIALSFSSVLHFDGKKYLIPVSSTLKRVQRKAGEPFFTATLFSGEKHFVFTASAFEAASLFALDLRKEANTFLTSATNKGEIPFSFVGTNSDGFLVGGVGECPLKRGGEYACLLSLKIGAVSRRIRVRGSVETKFISSELSDVWCVFLRFLDLAEEDKRLLFEKSSNRLVS